MPFAPRRLSFSRPSRVPITLSGILLNFISCFISFPFSFFGEEMVHSSMMMVIFKGSWRKFCSIEIYVAYIRLGATRWRKERRIETEAYTNTKACLRSRSSLRLPSCSPSVLSVLCLDVNWPIYKAIVWVVIPLGSFFDRVTYNWTNLESCVNQTIYIKFDRFQNSFYIDKKIMIQKNLSHVSSKYFD